MKTIYLLCVAVLTFSFISFSKEKQTFYYFCTSHNVANPKQEILLTEIKEIKTEESMIRDITRKWTRKTNDYFQDQKHTSDLNYYVDKNKAQLELAKTKSYYKDTSSYTINTISF